MSAKPSSAKIPAAAAPPEVRRTPTGTQSLAVLGARRIVFGTLVVLTLACLAWWLITILAADGFGVLDIFLLVTFLVYAPWVVIGFWNSTIGLAILLLRRNHLKSVIPLVERARPDDPIFVGVAVTMTIRNEDPARAFQRLRTVKESLDASAHGDKFDFYVLSDSSRPEVIEAEEAEYAAWQETLPDASRVVYRRREQNIGFKAGNVRDFLERWGAHYDIMVPLDADSLMTGESILRLVRVMQANPRLGILQSLVVGMPSPSFFARVFQFGMRHAMRSFITGSAWWHADCGPFWGHNAAIRVAAFREHCRLPELPGKPPFGGHILSHDQIEAALMRNAGFEVRVIPEEEGSWEEMPPALPDFVGRDLRWCQGNLQYFKLIDLPQLPTSRFNIAFAIQMFVGVAAYVLFVVFAAFASVAAADDASFPALSALEFYLLWVGMLLAPKIAGMIDAALNAPSRYGGLRWMLLGGAVETVFSFLLTSITMVGQTIFMAALLLGRKISWDGQRRDRYRLAWSEALHVFWPHTLFGWALILLLAVGAPKAIPWFLPFLAGLMFAIPFAVWTALPDLGAVAAKSRFCGIPEEFDTPRELAAVLPRPSA